MKANTNKGSIVNSKRQWKFPAGGHTAEGVTRGMAKEDQNLRLQDTKLLQVE